jgi:hypothetical protein
MIGGELGDIKQVESGSYIGQRGEGAGCNFFLMDDVDAICDFHPSLDGGIKITVWQQCRAGDKVAVRE